MRSRIVWTVLAVAVVLIMLALLQINLTAVQAPGRVETFAANWATRFFVHRASRQGITPRPSDSKASIASGAIHYGLECDVSHGTDGRAQTPLGRWMHPRAADLTSEQVQNYSDQELFWIVQNGIRFTGMPAFGQVETADHIWDLVNYVRTLPGDLKNEKSSM